MNVKEVYQKYRTPENLQKHMLRVAALGIMILRQWKGPEVDKKAIIQTLLFHDIAKPVTFDVSKQSKFISDPVVLDKILSEIQFLVDNYGADEHPAAMRIFQEIGLSQSTQRLIDNLEWHYTERLMEENDIESLITIYCDMRIGPAGLLTITERLQELHKRAPIDQFEKRLSSANELQSLIAKNADIDLDAIQSDQIEETASELLDTNVEKNFV